MIFSRQNRSIKDIRRLRRSKGDQLLVEGPHLLAEAVAAGVEIEVVLATPAFAEVEEHAELLASVAPQLQLVRADLLEAAADSDSPRGLVAIARVPRAGVEALPITEQGIYVYGDGLQEPGNLGALARVAEAAGATGLALGPGSAHPNHPRAIRASAGSLLRLPVAREVGLADLDRHLESVSPTRMALVPRGGDDVYLEELPSGAVIVLLGGEGPGLARETLEAADVRVTLPMRAPVESLNATVAGALVLYELTRRRR